MTRVNMDEYMEASMRAFALMTVENRVMVIKNDVDRLEQLVRAAKKKLKEEEEILADMDKEDTK
tara:strand:- start:310 stop:501 length:192 start_codon:yes stop_codon:yes gene_type:complete